MDTPLRVRLESIKSEWAFAGGEVYFMQIGDAVEIIGGPFAGLHGLLKAAGPRVLIVVEIHDRQIDVELDLDWVSAAVPTGQRVPAALGM